MLLMVTFVFCYVPCHSAGQVKSISASNRTILEGYRIAGDKSVLLLEQKSYQSHSQTNTITSVSSKPAIMRADVYDTRVLVRSDLLLPHFPAVVVAAGFRHKDLDDAVPAPVVYDDFPSRTHSGKPGFRPETRMTGLFLLCRRCLVDGCVTVFPPSRNCVIR